MGLYHIFLVKFKEVAGFRSRSQIVLKYSIAKIWQRLVFPLF